MKSLFSLVALMLLLNVATADVRTWTSRDGKTRFEAEIVGLAKDTDRVIMRKPDGTLLRVAIGFFSFDDQKHIKSLVPTLKRNVPFVNEKPKDAAGVQTVSGTNGTAGFWARTYGGGGRLTSCEREGDDWYQVYKRCQEPFMLFFGRPGERKVLCPLKSQSSCRSVAPSILGINQRTINT